MKKISILFIVIIISISWLLFNLSDIITFFHAKYVIEYGFSNFPKSEVEMVLEYEKELTSLRIRGCTIGAKLISINCLCPKLLQKNSLGEYWQSFDNNLQEMIENEEERKEEEEEKQAKGRDLFEENNILEHFSECLRKERQQQQEQINASFHINQ